MICFYPLSKFEAKSRDIVWYFTNKPCLRGHLSLRYVKSGVCRQCEIDRNSERKDYFTANKRHSRASKPEMHKRTERKWRKENPNKLAVYHQKANHKNKTDPQTIEKRRKWSRQNYAQNSEKKERKLK